MFPDTLGQGDFKKKKKNQTVTSKSGNKSAVNHSKIEPIYNKIILNIKIS